MEGKNQGFEMGILVWKEDLVLMKKPAMNFH